MQPSPRDSTHPSVILAIRSSAGFRRPKGLPESSSGHSATNFKQANSGTVGNFEPQEIAHCARISLFVPELGGDQDSNPKNLSIRSRLCGDRHRDVQLAGIKTSMW